jgi:NUMOD3 motif
MNTPARGAWRLTDETKHKISVALKDRPLTTEHRRAISAARRGAVPAHGDRNRYKRLGCRCEPCRQAQADYRRAIHSDIERRP